MLLRLLPPCASVLELEGHIKLAGAIHPSQLLRDNLALYVSVDLVQPPPPQGDSAYYHYLRGDCRSLPFRGGIFDLVHVTFPARAESFLHQGRATSTTFGLSHIAGSAAGVARVLKPGGCFVLFPFWVGDGVWASALSRAFDRLGYHLVVEGPYGGLYVAVFHCPA